MNETPPIPPEAAGPRPDKVVLAYSGGLDTSVMLHWIARTYDCEVVAYIANVGQAENLPEIERKARRTGASSVWTLDVRDEFVRDHVFPAIRANAVYEGRYLLGTALARPVIARYQLGVMLEEGADAVAHGATGKGNDQVRFELGYYALQPDVTVIAPWRSWPFRSRSDLLEYARENGVDVPASAEQPYSVDRNLLHCSYEGGILEDPWAAPPDDIFTLTRGPQDAPDEPLEITVSFEDGWPTAVDGDALGPAALLAHLNEVAGAHGVGRVDLVENRYVGIKSRGVYETPGGTVLHAALRAVESVTMDREVLRLRDSLAPRFAEAAYYGFWFAPEMHVLQASVDCCMKGITGTARLRLYKGSCQVVGRSAPHALYSAEHATFEDDDVYDQADAEGFIKLNALRLRLAARRSREAMEVPDGSGELSGDDATATADGATGSTTRSEVALEPAPGPGTPGAETGPDLVLESGDEPVPVPEPGVTTG